MILSLVECFFVVVPFLLEEIRARYSLIIKLITMAISYHRKNGMSSDFGLKIKLFLKKIMQYHIKMLIINGNML